MRITPLDIRKQEFNKSMRGFDCDEVQAFLNTLADEYETVLIDNKQIRERVIEQGEKISEYRNMERALRDTLMTAERVMQDTRETASREGEVIVQEAQLKAKAILEECRLRTEELRREIIGLRKEKETYLARFRGLAEAQIQFIDTHESDFEDLDKRLVDIVDTVVTRTTVDETSFAPTSPTSPISPTAPVARTVPTASPAASVIPVSPVTLPTAGTTNDPTAATAELKATPAEPPAPQAPPKAENDIWRDYSPGQSRPAESEKRNNPEETAASDIADIVSGSLSESVPGQHDKEKVTDLLNIDVISKGQPESGDQPAPRDESVTETLNI